MYRWIYDKCFVLFWSQNPKNFLIYFQQEYPLLSFKNSYVFVRVIGIPITRPSSHATPTLCQTYQYHLTELISISCISSVSKSLWWLQVSSRQPVRHMHWKPFHNTMLRLMRRADNVMVEDMMIFRSVCLSLLRNYGQMRSKNRNEMFFRIRRFRCLLPFCNSL